MTRIWRRFRGLPRRQQFLALGLVLAVVAGVLAAVAVARPPRIAEQAYRIPVVDGSHAGTHITIDATLYTPAGVDAGHPAAAVLVAHGFGGTKDSVADDARELAKKGYEVLAYTARGFGGSGGTISLDSPDYEVADARQLVSWLGARPEIVRDGPGDPRIGVTGASYGGALALLLAAYDSRVDAIVPLITWNDLGRAFFPNDAHPGDAPAATDGVFKRLWAGLFFAGSESASGGSGAAGDPSGGGSGGAGDPGGPGGQPGAGTGGGTGDPGGSGSTGTGGGTGDPGGHGGTGAGGGSGNAGGSGPPACDPRDPRCRSAGPDLGLGTANPCGRFAVELCAAYARTAQTGKPSEELLALLRRSSPASVLGRIHAPALLIQGETDTLFPLSEADANAKGIAANGTPVKVYWFAGGHDAGGDLQQTDRLRSLAAGWFDHYLRGGPDPGTSFEYTRISPPRTSDSSAPRTRTVVAPAYPTSEPDTQQVALAGPTQTVFNPPGGNPAAISALPGLGDLPGLELSGLGGDIPGQFAAFTSPVLANPVEVVGAAHLQLRIASSTSGATLFGKLYDVDTTGRATLPQRLVAPLRVTNLKANQFATVDLTLPAIVHRFDVGHRLRLVLATTDQAYAGPTDAAAYAVALVPGILADGSAAVEVPLVPGVPRSSGPSPVWWLAIGMAVIALAALVGWRVSRRLRRRGIVRSLPELVDVPLVVEDLTKRYRSGLLAVDGLTYRVERGQVCGLLGPNGAGKTTSLRVLMGLIHPTSGLVRVFGEAITPGAAVLHRVGAFVEGPGFLPHLSGMDNLTLYWRATGRPMEDAHLDEVLAIAGLGDAIHRRVRGYSHGMKQRLAIAQAMLGLPDLLVLDEPTNGLDPPQIRAMREVLREYAEVDGDRPRRTVLVSSHLLAEIEQTCTHVVVMNRGRLVAAGPVSELAGSGRLEDAFLEMLERELA